MKKLTNLNRLNFSNIIVLFTYYTKFLFGIKPTFKQDLVKGYYNHLISYNGFYKGEEENDFITFYPEWDIIIKLRKKPSSDMIVFNQIFEREEYKAVLEIFKKNFKKNSDLKIIDAGSNIGLTSLYFSAFFTDSEFICIEPDEQNFDVMSVNLDNKKIKKLHKIKGGVWSKNTCLKIVRDFRDQREWAVRVEETTEKTNLPAFSINSLIEKYNFETIDILKMDIEGSEKEVFTGLNADVSFLSITKCVAIEIHDEFNCRADINGVFKKYDFELFNSGELTIGINRSFISYEK
jgi:FkbM family methyltransferase